MKIRSAIIGIALLTTCTLPSCISRKAIDPPKNPRAIFSQVKLSNDGSTEKVNPFVARNYRILASVRADDDGTLRCVTLEGDEKDQNTNCPTKREYIAAGFALSDIYCETYFKLADEAERRRRFARGVTNDAGTAISTILGLANAGENVVTGIAAGFGLVDGVFRNYNEAFVIGPDLANVRLLVLAAQDNYRKQTLGKDTNVPKDFGTSQSAILRYANHCTTLGMQALLNKASSDKAEEIKKKTNPTTRESDGQQQVDQLTTTVSPSTRPSGLDGPIEPNAERETRSEEPQPVNRSDTPTIPASRPSGLDGPLEPNTPDGNN